MIEFHIEGKPIDKAIEYIVKEERPHVFSAEVDEFDQIITDARTIMEAYFDFWRGQKLRYIPVAGRRTEHEFEYDIGDGILLEGIIDCVPETPDKRRWIGEHKSHKVIPTEDVRMREIQPMLYSWAGSRALGIKNIVGVMWDYIRSKSPTVPEPLKDGSLSKRKIDTLPSVFLNEIKRLGLDPAHYSDKLGELDDRLSTWFKRVFMPINKDAMAQLVEETKVTGREMIRKAGVDKTRSISKDCSWCDYERLCHAELFGLDADSIRQREYRIKESKHEAADTED